VFVWGQGDVFLGHILRIIITSFTIDADVTVKHSADLSSFQLAFTCDFGEVESTRWDCIGLADSVNPAVTTAAAAADDDDDGNDAAEDETGVSGVSTTALTGVGVSLFSFSSTFIQTIQRDAVEYA